LTLHPDGRRLGLSWNPDAQANLVLGELDLASGAMTRWAEPGGFWEWSAWSPDGTRAVVVKSLGTPTEASILERYGRLRRILPDAVRTHPVAWVEEGILTLTDLGRDFVGLAVIDPVAPERVFRWVVSEEREVEGATIDPSSTRAAIVVNEGIHDSVRIVDLAAGRTLDRIDLPPGVVISDHTGGPDYHVTWSPNGSRLFVAWEEPTHPAEIYEWPGGTRWTSFADPPADLVTPVEVEYESFDSLRIPALLYKIDERPRPTVVQFHGGPEGQSRATFQPQAHLLNSIGVNLLLPNVRGSTGYGLKFQSLDDKTLRRNGIRDGCEAARFLKEKGIATKTAAMGGSYGGFMTLAVLVECPGLWDAAVDIVGIADWHTFFANMPPWRGVLRINEYGDPKGAEADFLRDISPIHRAESITVPLLVIHGRNDPRVPVEESEQIARVTGAELMIFEDEGHGIAALPNQVKSNRRILEFLGEHLS
jgi:pimeloyl-ACP methyl ester carboxylesterase